LTVKLSLKPAVLGVTPPAGHAARRFARSSAMRWAVCHYGYN